MQEIVLCKLLSAFALLLVRLDEPPEIPVFLSFLHVRHIVILILFLELDIALVSVFAKFVVLDSFQNCATGFIRVRAIRKTTGNRQVLNFQETLIKSIARAKKPELTHPGCVNQHGAVVL